MTTHLTNEQRRLVFRLRHRGQSTAAIARKIGLSWGALPWCCAVRNVRLGLTRGRPRRAA